jgi:hypothetical protein
MYLFSLYPLVYRGNNSEKRGIRAGIIGHYPAGIAEVIFGDVTGAERKWNPYFCKGWTGRRVTPLIGI